LVGTTTVRIAVDDDIIVEFEDGGAEYSPLLAENPDITLTAEEREIGGLGVFMVKKLMDSVEYRREGNKNILTIKKRRDGHAIK
jgi:anti-sigma regulatory factor (Ser/Thr protein kinase)